MMDVNGLLERLLADVALVRPEWVALLPYMVLKVDDWPQWPS